MYETSELPEDDQNTRPEQVSGIVVPTCCIPHLSSVVQILQPVGQMAWQDDPLCHFPCISFHPSIWPISLPLL